MPTRRQVELVICALRRMLSPSADLTADLVGLCYLTGVRVGAALAIRVADLEKRPDGTVWAYVDEKARPDRRPLLVRSTRPEPPRVWFLLPPEAYIFSYQGRRLAYPHAGRLLSRACAELGILPFSFHRLRHAFVSDAVPALGTKAVMQAGGWLAEPVFEGYSHRRAR